MTYMSEGLRTVNSAQDFTAVTKDSNVRQIVVKDEIVHVPSFRLLPGQHLKGEGKCACIQFVPGVDGVALSSDNVIQGLALRASPEQRAVFNDTGVASLGHIALNAVSVVGQVQILARDQVREGDVAVRGLHVIDADTRTRNEQSHGFGVYVLKRARSRSTTYNKMKMS